MKDTLFILLHYLKVKHRTFTNREKLLNWQEKQIQKHVQWIKENSPFYNAYLHGLANEKWQTFPLINKQVMMENFDTLNTVGIKKEEALEVAFRAEESRDFSPMINDITIGLSSGTSGNRGVFLVSEEERLLWTSHILAKVLPHHILSRKKSKVAFFLRANSNLYSTVEEGKITFSFYDLLDSIESHIQSLNEYKPTILVAPSSMLRMLAKAKNNNQLFIQPSKVINVAEVLDPIDEAYIEEAFQQTIHQVYQCTEGFLATTCEHGTLHLNEDMIAIQKKYLDKKARKFSPIITDFSRKSQPILRYELNDILTEKEAPCPCGSPFTAIEKIEGRCDDIFYFKKKDTNNLQPIFPDFIRRWMMQSSHKIEEYRVIQQELDEIRVEIKWESSSKEEESIHAHLEKFCHTQHLKVPKLTFAPYETHYGTDKMRRIERRVNLPENDQRI